MGFDGRSNHRRRRFTVSVPIGVVAVVAAGVLAGCGSSDSAGSATNSGSAATVAADSGAKVSATELQATVDRALDTDAVKAADLPQLLREALQRATPALSQAKLDKAYECWKANSCTIGNGKITLAQADGFGDNTWRHFTKMNAILQALTHPEVGKFIYTDANGQLASYQANLRTLTAKGVTAIATINEFGPAAYPALKAAQRAGAHVATYLGASADAPEGAITTRAEFDQCAVAKAMADTTETAVSAKGPVAYFEGLPGNPQDARVKECLAEKGVKPVFDEATDYTAAGTQKATSALIASGKPVKAILYSYANPVPSIVNTYLKAGKDIPAIITTTQSNETTCQWIEHPYKLYDTNSTNWAVRIAVDAAVEAAKGNEVPKTVIFPQPLVEAKKSNCDKSKPAEYPGPSGLVPDALAAKMLAAG
jgi:ABC-type sugar transport system substrate-binding protein